MHGSRMEGQRPMKDLAWIAKAREKVGKRKRYGGSVCVYVCDNGPLLQNTSSIQASLF